MNNVDYQALCKELFGTDDVKVLRKIAQTAGTHNPRNAGRKKKFTTADVRQMMELLGKGYTVNEIAARFQTSRQVISKYINMATRGNVKQLLRQMQIGGYDPLQIAEKTAGRMAEDNLWLKFDYYKGVAKRGTNIVVRQ